MRLFTSIDFPDDILSEIQSWIPKMKGWKKASEHQLHLTLAFLGECSEQDRDEIHERLSDISFSPFTVKINGLGAFPNEKSPRIIWAGIDQNEELLSLQENVSSKLNKFIKSKDSYGFIPHITLSRKKSKKSINQIPWEDLKRETPVVNVNIDCFFLKKSILKPEGSEHQVLHRYTATSIE